MSTAVTVAGFALASAGAAAFLYSSVYPFSHYGRVFGIGFGEGAIPGLLAVAIGLSIATWSCLVEAGRRSRTRLHRLDWFFVLIVLVGLGTVLAGLVEAGRSSLGWHVVCLTMAAISGGYLWATVVVRVRARTVKETIFWPRVFAVLPLRQFSGIFILAVVVIACGIFLLGAEFLVQTAVASSAWNPLPLREWLWQGFVVMGLPALTLAVVAVLCANILSITAAREAAVEAQLREERFRAELITNVTHDIRTPLTSIVSYVDLIDRLELDDPTLAEYTAVLGRKAERLKVLIGDLLEASRASAGTLAVRLQPIDLIELVAQVAGNLDDRLVARGITWVGPPPQPVWVQADGEQLWRIVDNLVGNVAKYARPGSCAHAELHRSGSRVALRLMNPTAEPLLVSGEELVAQFRRGDAARQTEGSGLGLFIADRLAQLMGGSLRVVVDGTQFAVTVALPAAVGPAVEWASAGGQAALPDQLTGAGHELR